MLDFVQYTDKKWLWGKHHHHKNQNQTNQQQKQTHHKNKPSNHFLNPEIPNVPQDFKEENGESMLVETVLSQKRFEAWATSFVNLH